MPSIVLILHVIVARKVTVIVRARVRSIIPVHCGISVLSCTPKHCCSCFEVVVRCHGVLQDGDRFECLADAGIAELAVLISPVAVVHVVADKVIHLLCRCILCTTLTRSGKSHETELMDIAEFLLDSEIVSEITVVYTLDPVVSSKSCRHIESI